MVEPEPGPEGAAAVVAVAQTAITVAGAPAEAALAVAAVQVQDRLGRSFARSPAQVVAVKAQHLQGLEVRNKTKGASVLEVQYWITSCITSSASRRKHRSEHMGMVWEEGRPGRHYVCSLSDTFCCEPPAALLGDGMPPR
jgi:hypothetical protein